jgi:hypothetical protein
MPVLCQRCAAELAHRYSFVTQVWKAGKDVGSLPDPTSAIHSAIQRCEVANTVGRGTSVLGIGQLQSLKRVSIRHEQDVRLDVAPRTIVQPATTAATEDVFMPLQSLSGERLIERFGVAVVNPKFDEATLPGIARNYRSILAAH